MSISKVGFKIIGKYLRQKKINIIGSLFYYSSGKKVKDNVILDYVRSATLELVADEIEQKKLVGSMAEVGVFTGEFAARLNELFPERKLYLFDTFEGFDERDTNTEKNRSFSTADQNFSKTSVELVLDKMTKKDSCIVRKGFFPETAEGIEDNFVFVSLDADLYQPILAGLNYFYPRLVKGGYIFVHDYNNMNYKGARQAVQEFCTSNGISILPIPDICGTAVISK